MIAAVGDKLKRYDIILLAALKLGNAAFSG